MEKRVCQRPRKSWSGCPLRHCSWSCHGAPPRATKYRSSWWFVRAPSWGAGFIFHQTRNEEDRKSTRLNSSHVEISYAVFCLKKKKKQNKNKKKQKNKLNTHNTIKMI